MKDKQINPINDKVPAFSASNHTAILVDALRRIVDWSDFPATGQLYPDGSPVSYAVAYGSNGQRDFMRNLAGKALADYRDMQTSGIVSPANRYPVRDVMGQVDIIAEFSQSSHGTDGEMIMEKAKELFGWVAGLGGFDNAVMDLTKYIVGHRFSQPAQVPDVSKQLTNTQIYELLPDRQNGWSDEDYGMWVARAIERAHGIYPDAQVPDGWKLVPVEPDEKMLSAMREIHWEIRGCQLCAEDYRDIHTAILAASPAPEVKL